MRDRCNLPACHVPVRCPPRPPHLACCEPLPKLHSHMARCWRAERCIRWRYHRHLFLAPAALHQPLHVSIQEYLSDPGQVDIVYLTVLTRASGEPLRFGWFIDVIAVGSGCTVSLSYVSQFGSGGQVYCAAQALSAQVCLHNQMGLVKCGRCNVCQGALCDKQHDALQLQGLTAGS